MQSKPTTSDQHENRSQDPRDPSAVLAGRARSSHLDLARAEGEGMGEATPDASASGDAERHHARYGALSRNVMVFDLASEAKQLTLPFESVHTARTLAKLDTIRLTLMKLSANSTIREHQVAHQVSLQTVSGHVVVHVEGQPLEMPAGHVIVLARGIAHDIVAKEDSVVLLTVSAP
jgi:quercetin dioxygenase-like cupin family protein